MTDSIYDRLKAIVDGDRVSTDTATLAKYSRDQSFVRPCTPDCVVFAETVDEVQDVVRAANDTRTPVVPVSSGMNLRGAAIPREGGIILDLSRMNKIEEIRDGERWALVQAGVTFGQLTEELEKHNLRVLMPLGVPRSRSILSSVIEEDPLMAAARFEYGNYNSMDSEMVLPTGELHRTGNWATRVRGKWSNPGGGGILNQYGWDWMWHKTQGTLSVMTRIVVKAEHHIPQVSQVFVFPFDRLEEAIGPLRRILRLEIGMELFLLNNFNLAAVRTDDWDIPESLPCQRVPSDRFDSLRSRLPRWTMIIHLAGLPEFPEEKVAYEKEDLRDICNEAGLNLAQTVAGEAGLDKTLLDLIWHPWLVLKKAHFKGSFHPLGFYTTLGKVAELEETVMALAQEHGYPPADIGGYLLPIETGLNCYLEMDFHCDFNDPDDVERVKNLWLEANRVCTDKGAVADKAYGPIADIVYQRVEPAYIETLRSWKKELDPNNILNPGQLCF